jgi:hypothetical protein
MVMLSVSRIKIQCPCARHEDIKGIKWSRGTTVPSLSLGTRWKWLASHPGRFIRAEEPRYPLGGRLIGPREPVRTYRRGEFFYPYLDSNP